MNRRFSTHLFAPVLLLLLATAALALAAPPANDNFANRITLSGSLPLVTSGSNVEATKQNGEYNHAGYTGGKSVWWTWTAPTTGVYTMRTDGSSFNTIMAVYTGTAVNALSFVAGDNDAGAGNNSLVTFEATAGTTCHIVVDGYSGASGSITLTIDLPVLAPENDNFANRISLGSGAASVTSHNRLCSKEPGEPNHWYSNGGKSVWFTWTPPHTGECAVQVSTTLFTPLQAVYTGSAVNALTLVASGYPGSPTVFHARVGTVYQFVVDGSSGGSGTFTLSINNPIPPPVNDDFANATAIPSLPASITVSNVAASREPGEPVIWTGGDKSVWWKWTATSTGECVVTTTPGTISPVSEVYTGTSVDSLTKAALYWDMAPRHRRSFRAIPGTTYYVVVSSTDSRDSGTCTLDVSQLYTPPANDDFANRAVLPASGVSFSGTNIGATREADEPAHGGPGLPVGLGTGTGGRSLWWSWTAPSSGEVGLRFVSPITVTIGVYTGDSLNALNKIAGLDTSLTFWAVAGTTYQIAMDSYNGGASPFTLILNDPVLPPSNDNFASSIPLTGLSIKIKGTTLASTRETGEPVHAGWESGKSVWYSWTAPATGNYKAYVQGEYPGFQRLGIYTGSNVSSLTPVAGTSGYGGDIYGPLALAFSATSGTTYQIAVASAYGWQPSTDATSGVFTLNISQPAANENFAASIDLGSAANGGSTSWVDYGGSTDPGEPGEPPPYAYQPGPRTIWWKWTAPASGFFTFHTLGADFDTALQVYTGSALNALTLVKENHDADSQGRSSLALNATQGTTYYIRVSGETPADIGQVPLQWSQLGAPATAADHVALGRAWLQTQSDAGVANADASFAAALALDANHPEANLFKAFTTFAMLEQGTAFQNTLTALGIADSGIYERRHRMPKDPSGNRIVQVGTSNTTVGINYLADTVLPALTVIRSHLSRVSAPDFLAVISDTETKDRVALIDAGDISLIQAGTHGMEAVIRLLQTYNAGVDVASVITAANNDTLTVENVASSFTNLLTFTGNDQRAAFKTALQSANTYYQAGSTFVRTTRADKRKYRHLFYLDAKGGSMEEKIRENLQATSNSLNGATTVGGETVNLAQAITSTKSLREQLMGLVGNKGVASTVPDPTFDGVVPNSSQAKVNHFLRRTGFLHEIANFSNWAAAFLGGQAVPNQAKSADPDKDMLSNFAEYAFNLDPSKSSATQEYAVSSLQTNVSDGKKYLQLTFVRRIDRATINYVVAVSDDLTGWDRTGTQLEQVGSTTPNADGVTETVTVRVVADPQVVARKFVRLEVSELP